MRGGKIAAEYLWVRTRKHDGDVLDSRHGSVRWARDDDAHAFDVRHEALPPTRVTFRLAAVTLHLDGAEHDVEVGSRGIRRATWGATVRHDGHEYRLRQRGRRLAELTRGEDTVAVLARPRRGSRSINWSMALVTDTEIAIGHALALTGGIGSPGAVANISSALPV